MPLNVDQAKKKRKEKHNLPYTRSQSYISWAQSIEVQKRKFAAAISLCILKLYGTRSFFCVCIYPLQEMIIQQRWMKRTVNAKSRVLVAAIMLCTFWHCFGRYCLHSFHRQVVEIQNISLLNGMPFSLHWCPFFFRKLTVFLSLFLSFSFFFCCSTFFVLVFFFFFFYRRYLRWIRLLCCVDFCHWRCHCCHRWCCVTLWLYVGNQGFGDCDCICCVRNQRSRFEYEIFCFTSICLATCLFCFH